MAELIGCRSCDSPNCMGCNVYTLDEALRKKHFNLLMDEHHSVHINADVQPVVKGKWIKHDFVDLYGRQYTGSVECPFCMRLLPSTENFCPNCGADMRGAGNDRN